MRYTNQVVRALSLLFVFFLIVPSLILTTYATTSVNAYPMDYTSDLDTYDVNDGYWDLSVTNFSYTRITYDLTHLRIDMLIYDDTFHVDFGDRVLLYLNFDSTVEYGDLNNHCINYDIYRSGTIKYAYPEDDDDWYPRTNGNPHAVVDIDHLTDRWSFSIIIDATAFNVSKVSEEIRLMVILTDYNPNVFWELGVRQSFKHNTITIAEEGVILPFDVSSLKILICLSYFN